MSNSRHLRSLGSCAKQATLSPSAACAACDGLDMRWALSSWRHNLYPHMRELSTLPL